MCSNYTGCREIIIRNAGCAVPDLGPQEYKHEKKMTTGFLGLGQKQTAVFKVETQKSVYMMGEQISLKVTSDNSGCDKPME